MSNKPSNHELDDELLSAYIDGELSADQRTAVEARLVTDPAARQLLHELRSVSQSVQALPTESLGRDLSEEILRSARAALPASGKATHAETVHASDSARLIDTMPKIKIFNSKRSWIWASMALAAGLLIMFIQAGNDAAKKMPDVAAHDRKADQAQLADEIAPSRRREVVISSAPESPAPLPATVAVDSEVHENVDALGKVMPAAPRAGGGPRGPGELDGAGTGPPLAAASPAMKPPKDEANNAVDRDAGSRTLTAQPEQMASDKVTSALQPTGALGGSATALGVAAEKQKSESIINPNTQRFAVVRVVAKPEAISNGSFERLLADNKIEFVPQPVNHEPLSFGGGKLAPSAQSESKPQKPASKSAEAHTSNMEVILVEAPAHAIESCLADLNKNANDFVSIAVNENPQSNDRFDAKSAVTKTLAEINKNLSRFSRGSVPATQKDISRLQDYYYAYNDTDEPSKIVANGSPRAAGASPEVDATGRSQPGANGAKVLADKSQPIAAIRRARRIETHDTANRAPGEQAVRSQAGAELLKQPASQRTPSDQPEAKADNQSTNWKVLFVFTPEETSTPSAQPDNRPK